MAPHAILLPLPTQGHVIPFLELAYRLADHGVKVTFVNTHFTHDRVVAAASSSSTTIGAMGLVKMVSVPDGLGPDEDHRDLIKLGLRFPEVLPVCLEELVRNNDDDKITCMIVDESLGCVLEIAKKLGLYSVGFWPAAAASLAAMSTADRLIEDGIIDAKCGRPKTDSVIQVSPGMPAMTASELVWNAISCGTEIQESIFKTVIDINRALAFADAIICNSFRELESPTFTFFPKFLPIGPFLTGRRLGKPVGHFWPDDSTCLTWLDEQPANSVIYVAFGSHTILKPDQFRELAIGLELAGRPFLWVVRPDLVEQSSDAYPTGFRARVASQGKIVAWSPQQRVLAHPSIACFVTHCGWNSIMEGITNGVTFLCWPYFTDQFLNRTYICDVWRTGLKVSHNEEGLVSKDEFKSKVKALLNDAEIRARALELKDLAMKAVSDGGSSLENFKAFIDAIKQ